MLAGQIAVRAQGRPEGKSNLKNPPVEEPGFPPPEKPPAPETARLEVLGDASLQIVRPGVFRMGDVLLDQDAREVRFPAELNMAKGPVEYLLCSGYGKVHESVLRSKAQPYHIHVAMLLLGAGKVEKKPDDQVDISKLGGPIRNPVWQGITGDAVSIDVRWLEGEKEIRRSASELMFAGGTKKTMGDPKWIYNGSVAARGVFYAQLFGNLISVIPDEAALINSGAMEKAGSDMLDVNSELAPPAETPLEVIIKLRSPE